MERTCRIELLLGLTLIAAAATGACDDGGEADDPVCSASRPVIGGEQTGEGLYPATGALMTDGQFSCTGTLIAPDVVLTAGHCVADFFGSGSVPGFTLALDANSVGPGDIHAGLEKYEHPEFNFQTQPYNDIGLLVLAQPFEGVAVAILPSEQEGNLLVEGGEAVIVGYGMTTVDSQEAGLKHHATTHIASVAEFELGIARPGEPQNCRGDSGGPSYFDAGGGNRIVGVVSGGPEPCTEGGFHTRVDAYLEWIDSVVETECGGLGEPCDDEDPDDDDGGPDDGGPDDDGTQCP